MRGVTHRERLIATVARVLEGVNHVAVGASSPIPAAAAMLLRAQREAAGETPVRLSILGSVEHNFFTNGGAELFDCAAQGRIDAFFLGGGQIDGTGNINLAERFPRLVHCRVSGFGADGPYGGRPGYDAAVQALTGIMSVNGEKGGEPLRVGLPVVDMVTGLNAAIGILLALQERQKSGKGQFVETTLYDCGVSLLHPHLANFHLNGKVPGPSGSAHPNITTQNR